MEPRRPASSHGFSGCFGSLFHGPLLSGRQDFFSCFPAVSRTAEALVEPLVETLFSLPRSIAITDFLESVRLVEVGLIGQGGHQVPQRCLGHLWSRNWGGIWDWTNRDHHKAAPISCEKQHGYRLQKGTCEVPRDCGQDRLRHCPRSAGPKP